MTLITRQGKGSKLTIQEMDGNLTYLEQLGKGQKLIEEADFLSRTQLPLYEISENVELLGGTFKTQFVVPQFFLFFDNDLEDVELWKNGPVIVEDVEGVVTGYSVKDTFEFEQTVDFSLISGFMLPANFDLSLFGAVDIFSLVVGNTSATHVIKSTFFDVKYQWDDLGEGQYEHLFWVQFGNVATFVAEISGDQDAVTVDIRFL
jgi:hypothetical protein